MTRPARVRTTICVQTFPRSAPSRRANACSLVGYGIRIDSDQVDRVKLLRNRTQYNRSGVALHGAIRVWMESNIATDNTNYGVYTDAGTTGYTIISNDFWSNGIGVRLTSREGRYENNRR